MLGTMAPMIMATSAHKGLVRSDNAAKAIGMIAIDEVITMPRDEQRRALGAGEHAVGDGGRRRGARARPCRRVLKICQWTR